MKPSPNGRSSYSLHSLEKRFEAGSTKNSDLEALLRERDLMLQSIKEHLLRAQNLMKNNADKKRRDVEYEVGAEVFLKLRPYRQSSVTKRLCHKFAAKYYGPFEILERVGKVAYRLKLPVEAKIHPVFHVSQLKAVLGQAHEVNPFLTVSSEIDEFVVVPQELLDTRYNAEGHLEGLIHWKGLPPHENTWVLVKDLIKQFPTFDLGDMLHFKDGGIDKPQRVYFVKKKKKKRNRVLLENEKLGSEEVKEGS